MQKSPYVTRSKITIVNRMSFIMFFFYPIYVLSRSESSKKWRAIWSSSSYYPFRWYTAHNYHPTYVIDTNQ